MSIEVNQNKIDKTLVDKDISEKNEKSAGILNRENSERGQIEALTPKEKKEAKITQDQLDGAMQKGDVLSINEIIRNPATKKLLSPEAIRKAFSVLRSIHMEEAKKHIDTANLGSVRDDITNRLDTVATGYHELFKNLQGRIETLGPIDNETGENIAHLQNEVEEAEISIKNLLSQINRIGNNPEPLRKGVEDMPPEPTPQDTKNNI